ncbi:hypothetical protein ADUPG1_005272, partial [Aduncisulcus paluster]
MGGVDGCLMNVMTVRSFLSDHEDHCAMCLDISDAYGSVPTALLDAVLRKICSTETFNFLASCFSVTIHTSDGQTVVTLRGLPQGLNLSPIYFNLCLDCCIPTSIRTHLCTFADDLIVLAKGYLNLQSMVDSLVVNLSHGNLL